MSKLMYSHNAYVYIQEFKVTISEQQLILLDNTQSEIPHGYVYRLYAKHIDLIYTPINNTNNQPLATHTLALLDALFACFKDIHIITLKSDDPPPIYKPPSTETKPTTMELSTSKANTQVDTNNELHCYLDALWMIGSEVHRELFYQQQNLWLNTPTTPSYPTKYVTKNNHYYPLRPSLNNTIVYQRYIPWLQATLSFRLFDTEKDLVTFSTWMNDPDIDYFWEEAGSLDAHKDYINERLKSESVTTPLMGCLDGQPFGYFETYWAKEDRLSIYYTVNDFDRGWHVLIGDKSCRGKAYVTAWMPAISHYLFLSDSRTQHIVIEPRIDNEKMIKSLNKCGYAHLKTFDFPHKRAMLGLLSREHFFSSLALLPRPSK